MLKNRVFAVMADRGIRTQKELAERIGISVSNVGNIVNDQFKAIRRDTLESLCRVLNCQPGDLFEYVPDAEAQPKKKGRK